MRSINTLEWHAGQTGSISLDKVLLLKLSKFTLKVLLYVPYQLNSYLNSLDDAPNPYRKKTHDSHTIERDIRHQHIPSRVWQRRSALITMLEEQREVTRLVDEESVKEVSHDQSESTSADGCSSCSFNVLQVRCLPVWASNFSDISLIEQELDFYSRAELLKKVV